MNLIWTLLIAFSLLLASNARGAEEVPLQRFAELPRFKDPMISPNGKRIAVTLTLDGRPLMVVQKLYTETDRTKEDPVPFSIGEFFFSWYDWANDERLIVSIRSNVKSRGSLWSLSRLVTASRKGKSMKVLPMTTNLRGYYRQHATVVDWLEHDPDHILAALDNSPTLWAAPEVDLVNVNTGKSRRVVKNKKGIHNWIVDSRGVVRVGVKRPTNRGLRETVYYRETEEAQWEVLQRIDHYHHDRLMPIRFDKQDPNILLVSSVNLAKDENTVAKIFRYDLTAREVVGPFVDTRRKKVLKLLKNALPDVKVDIVSHDRAKKTYIVRTYSDVTPPDYYRLDLNRNALEFLASERPELVGMQFAPMTRITYTARDGLEIPAYLTLPVGREEQNLPLVVYPHGGPWSRDEWGWDNYVQFLANRGYAVLQPQFRGSTGFGIEHQEAGYGQWGHAIQDDITDGVKWVIDRGVADPDRICIIGASFGGYAAAMGVAKTPNLYRCAVSINGVLNLKRMIDDGRDRVFSSVPRAIVNDRKDSEDASPYHLAKRIKAPVLLIAGEKDTVVPAIHSRKMYKRLKKLKKPVEYIELEDGEHWHTNEAHELIVFTALERFLATHIGGASSVQARAEQQ
ncbi:S9 family peptidase [Exilibacterium tricleocarpae]|uniref:S9 family peptidase n=1 Tax=Exilibacterium tricleocarpae TaxID=2591008 RepID=A0A545SNF7_9GAMM|nr:S9 family peptidase [Exilibacterium tricleocarpae]TQV66499.1 S9 family peptidase [Exilibacterium tricleocarpae]